MNKSQKIKIALLMTATVLSSSAQGLASSVQRTIPATISINHYEIQERGITGVDLIDANQDFSTLIADKGDAYVFESQLQDFRQISSYTGNYQLINGQNTIFTKELSRPFVESVKNENNVFYPVYKITTSGENVTVNIEEGKHGHIDVNTKLVTDSFDQMKETKDTSSGITIQKPEVSHNEFNNKASIKKGQTVFQYHRKGSDLEVIKEDFKD